MEQQLLQRFKDMVLEKNRVMNLTSITDPDEFDIRHIQDSLILNDYLPISPGMKIADLGTGAGFPGIPLAITHPDCEFHLFDSVNKKLKFIQEVVEELDLKNVRLHHGRLEDMAHLPEHREQYDIVVSRAVAPLPVLLEYMAGFSKTSGQITCYKSQKFNQELEQSDKALKQLDLELLHTIDYTLGDADHVLAVFGKTKPLNKRYPRKAGTPTNHPL